MGIIDTGLQLDPKAAFGEGLIGGTTGGVAQAPSSIYASTRQEIENEPLTTDETPLLPAAPVVEEVCEDDPCEVEESDTHPQEETPKKSSKKSSKKVKQSSAKKAD